MRDSEEAIWDLSRTTFKNSDFDNGFPILWYRFGILYALKEFSKAWVVALHLCHSNGFGVAPYMAFLYVNAAINLKERRGDYR